MVHNRLRIYNLLQQNDKNIIVPFKVRLADDIAAIENRILNLQKRLENNLYKPHLEDGVYINDELHITLHYCYALRHFIEVEVHNADITTWTKLPSIVEDVKQLSTGEIYDRIADTKKTAITELTD